MAEVKGRTRTDTRHGSSGRSRVVDVIRGDGAASRRDRGGEQLAEPVQTFHVRFKHPQITVKG